MTADEMKRCKVSDVIWRNIDGLILDGEDQSSLICFDGGGGGGGPFRKVPRGGFIRRAALAGVMKP